MKRKTSAERMSMTTPPTPHNDDTLAALNATATELSDQVERLSSENSDRIIEVAKYTRRSRRMIWGLTLSLALDVMLTMLLFNIQHRIESVTDRLDRAQTVQRQGALCPLYQVFIDSKSDAARQRSVDPVKYDQAYAVIEDGYRKLRCADLKDLVTPSLPAKP